MALATRGNPIATVFGAIFGGLIGSSIGHDQDRQDRPGQLHQGQQVAAQHEARQMSLNEIVQMSQQNVGDQIIINQIMTTGSIFALNFEDISYLKSQRVSDAVISVMQQRTVRVVPAPLYGPAPDYVVDQPPPPPQVTGVVVIGR